MRVRILHMMCTALLILSPHFLVTGCSGTSQEDGDLEGNASAENGSDEGNATENVADEGSNSTASEDVAAEDGGEGNNFNTEGGDKAANPAEGEKASELAGDATKSDLEDIIAGQNADQAAPAADASAAASMPAESTEVPAAVAQTTPAPVAAAISAGPALPEQGSKMPYIVRVGDSLSSIAKHIYGNQERWSEIAELTSLKNPNLVRPGDVVYYQLNQETLAFATAYEGAPRNEVTVQSGDTLAQISKRVYGNPGDWKFVWRQNANIQDPDRLEVGQTIFYLSPATLSAALNYAKSLSIAKIMNSKNSVKVTKVLKSNNSAPVQQTVSQNNNVHTNSTTVNGFELALDMYNAFATNLNFAG